MSKLFFEGIVLRREPETREFYPIQIDCQEYIAKTGQNRIFSGSLIELKTDCGPVVLIFQGVMNGQAVCTMNWLDRFGNLHESSFSIAEGALVRLASIEERRRD